MPDASHDKPQLFSLRSSAGLLERVCAELGTTPGQHEERNFEDGEHKIRVLESVRDRDVYLLQSLHGDAQASPNDRLVRVLFFAASLRDAGARRVTCITPYLCYARKDRRTKSRDPVTHRYVACLFEALRVDRIVGVDVHNPAAFENAFRIAAEHLTAAPALARALLPKLGDADLVVVSPDTGGAKRAEALRQVLQGLLHRPVGLAFVEKFRSEGVVRGSTVVGDVQGRTAVVVDDLIASGRTLARAARACRHVGARTAHAVATHGVFAEQSSTILRDSDLESVLITNTIPPEGRLDPDLLSDRVQVIDCASLLAQAITRLHTGASLTDLTDTP